MTDDKADDRVTISRETLQWALDALCELSGPGDLDVCDDLRAALAAQPATVKPVEPVAWRWRFKHNGQWDDWKHYAHKPTGPSSDTFQMEPLYAAPAAVPLTDEQIDEIWDGTFRSEDPNRKLSFRQIITRAIERAHGIAAAGDKP